MNARSQRAYFKFTLFHQEIVSGDLIIIFGRRASIFKTGWNGRYPELHPNTLRVCEALEWAVSQDCVLADFVGLGKELAEPLLDGRKVTPELSMRKEKSAKAYC